MRTVPIPLVFLPGTFSVWDWLEMVDSIQILPEEDLPALHNAANAASLRAGKSYLFLFGSVLILTMIGAFLSAVSVTTSENKSLKALLTGIAFFVGFILTSTLRAKKHEREWYGGRAIAESVKTLTWRFMCRAEPYSGELAPKAVDEAFLSSLNDILSQRKSLFAALNGELGNGPQITNRMREVRSWDTEHRREFYVNARIENQRGWYSDKAKANRRKEDIWFAVIMIAQVGAAVSALLLVYSPDSRLNLTGSFSMIATAALAWLQVKRHQELAQSYNVTAQELGLIAAKAGHIAKDDQLSAFVADAENAISREHTLWIARRDNP
ncbi:MAG: hypothetical protein DMF61_11155 [Blastocatellia bacterium AA13]|nr:MAG: hypothetical protein DMF61_11155 [Blastocatellia bacterium AA13]